MHVNVVKTLVAAQFTAPVLQTTLEASSFGQNVSFHRIR